MNKDFLQLICNEADLKIMLTYNKDFDDEGEWALVGNCLKQGVIDGWISDDVARQIWINWSIQSIKWQNNDENKWKYFNGNGSGIGHLYKVFKDNGGNFTLLNCSGNQRLIFYSENKGKELTTTDLTELEEINKNYKPVNEILKYIDRENYEKTMGKYKLIKSLTFEEQQKLSKEDKIKGMSFWNDDDWFRVNKGLPNGKFNPNVYSMTKQQILDTTEPIEYIKVNSFKNGNKTEQSDIDVNDFRFMIIELDLIPKIEDQIDLIWRVPRLPIRRITLSGGKSIHILLETGVKTFEDYQNFKGIIYDCLTKKIGLAIDDKCKNCSRSTRLPGFFRRNTPDGRKNQYQGLLFIDENCGCENLVEWINYFENNYKIVLPEIIWTKENSHNFEIESIEDFEEVIFKTRNDEEWKIQNGVWYQGKLVIPTLFYLKEIIKLNNNLFYHLRVFTEGKWIDEYFRKDNLLQETNKIKTSVVFDKTTTKFLTKYLIDFLDTYNVPYLNGTDEIGIDKNEKFIGLSSDFFYRGKTYKNPFLSGGDKEKHLEALKEIWTNGSKAEILMLSTLGISICTYQMKNLPVVWEFFGKSGIGKTRLSQVMLSLFNKIDGDFFTSGDSTEKSILKKVYDAGFLPQVYDELELRRGTYSIQTGALAYKLAAGKERQKLKRDSENDFEITEAKNYYNCIIFTGENTMIVPESKGGSLNRIISVSVKEEDIIYTHKNYDVLKENYGWFIKELEEKSYFNKEDIKGITTELKKHLTKETTWFKEIANKQQEFFLYLLATMNFYNKILGKCQYIGNDFVDFFRKQDEIDIVEKSINDISSWIFSNQNLFDQPDLPWAKELVGWLEDRHYILKSEFDKLCKEKNIPFETIKDDLVAKGFLIKQNNRYSFLKRHRGTKLNVVCIETDF